MDLEDRRMQAGQGHIEEDTMRTATVTVGLDHTPAGVAAVRYAVDLAAAEGRGEVLAIHAFELPTRPERSLERDMSNTRRELLGRCQYWIDEAIPSNQADVSIRLQIRDGDRQDVLVRASRDTGVLVVGAPSVARTAATGELLTHLRANVRSDLIEVDEIGAARRTVGDMSRPTRQFMQPA
jgi:hypothetical protein